MRFANLYAAWLFMAVALLILLHILAERRRSMALQRFAPKELLEELASGLHIKKRRWKTIIFIAALSLCVTALMRPQWGMEAEEGKARGLDILVALDTSRSMLADDERPDRLTAAKSAIEQLTSILLEDRIGLVAFAGGAFLTCPLTSDYNAFLQILRETDVDTIPRGGSSISSALKEAQKGFRGGSGKGKVLLLLSDGETHGEDFSQEAREMSKAGIEVFAIGVGTQDGALLPLKGDGSGFLKARNGAVVKSRLDLATLRGVAEVGGGETVLLAANGSGLADIYRDRLAVMEKNEYRKDAPRQYRERFQVPLALALFLLLLEPIISERKKTG